MKNFKWDVEFNIVRRHKDRVSVLGETKEKALESFKYLTDNFIGRGNQIEVLSVFKREEHKDSNSKQMSFDMAHKGEENVSTDNDQSDYKND